MNQINLINQLLDDMDTVRPLLLSALPDNSELRATTRRMIAALEQLREQPGIPHATHLWVSQQFAKLLDVHHAPLLRPAFDGTITNDSKESLAAHVQQRQMLTMQALKDIPATHDLLDTSSEMIGEKAGKNESLQKRAQHLHLLLQRHLQHDADLRVELQQLAEAFGPSLNAISGILKQAGEESPELKQATELLERELPKDPDQALVILQQARAGILTAGNKLSSASEKLNETIQSHIESLSTLSKKLEEAESAARNDPLTGLANRRLLDEYLKELGQTVYSCLLIDIDHFKRINDTYGHDVGDEILEQIARMLDKCTRSTDIAARVGGEEFCIIFPGTGTENSTRMAEILRQSIEKKSFGTSAGMIDITASIGLAEHIPGTEHSATFKASDEALYRSKKNGRNRISVALKR
ncbi:diguanylate cyclase (GGDEF) domain-containing protein [Mariprofundus ferrinatatus]|uniref:diguanylate cyclase n=1 Tax=Mariprofundus ferrinatatus TaxID=1921087 RepID=A0A2K8L1J0_9PROT|nr:GGDEF domain-containing protein [Mariprofundus ferrinatatus]ATX81190.1 diguanylate cyclase (GGDEF) domain-containing protein [Mariprofundus ferrinatatus]